MPLSLYTLLLNLLVPVALFKLWRRGRRLPDYRRHIPERFGIYSSAGPEAPVIWLHAVSVGETQAAAPLVERLLQRYPGYRILLTHTTPTGRATGEQLFGDRVLRAYLPYDLPEAMQHFLAHFRPRIGLLLETELWFNLIAACRARNTPLLLVNARLSEKSARGYARLGSLTRLGLQGLACVAAQTDADAERLRALGARNVSVTGNLKFDVTPPPQAAALGSALRERWGKARPVFLAASTRDGEEALILDAVRAAAIPDLLTVIVPRHPQRFDDTARLLQRRGMRFVRRSMESPVAADCQVVLGDSMGEMHAYYAACDVAFIGGSLLPGGGQNLIEACAMGRPVLIGPHTWNFAAITQSAIAAEAALCVEDAAALTRALDSLLNDHALRSRMAANALAFSRSQGGAVDRLLGLIGTQLPDGS
jgi:3-deoxy-D-manno-octulosonic-acid transferase